MARALKKDVDTDLVKDDLLDDTVDNEEKISGDLDDYIRDVFSELGDDFKENNFVLKIYRVVENRGELAWLFSCTPAELPILDKLRDEYDGGRFEVRVYRDKKIYRRKVVLIETPKVKVLKSTDTNSELIKMMMEGFNKLADKMQSMNVQPQPLALDPMKMFESMATVMSTMQKMQPIIPNQSSVNSVDSGLALVMRGMEIAESMRSQGSESTFMDVVRDVIKSPVVESLADLLKNKSATIAQPSTQRPMQNHPIVKPLEKVDEMNMVKKQYINMLLNKAREDASPILYAEYIVDNAPEEIIREHFMGAGVLDTIIKDVPEVSKYKEWFVELQSALIAILDMPEDDDHNVLDVTA